MIFASKVMIKNSLYIILNIIDISIRTIIFSEGYSGGQISIASRRKDTRLSSGVFYEYFN